MAIPAAALTIAVLAAGIYGIAGLSGNGAASRADSACATALAAAQRAAPFARGEVAAVQVATKPLKLPDLAFTDAGGKPQTLENWRGRTILLNLWATWCHPCKQEMPALDELQAKRGGSGFEVVAVNIDTRNLERPKQWLEENKVTRLAYHADPSAKIFQELKTLGKAFGMPTTLLIDGEGCEIASIAGPAEWSSEDALKLVDAVLGK